jgi:predicted nucleic acid-binding protein
VLCDTVCVWALYFRDSAYREHVLRLREEHGLVVPDVCLVECAYPVYRAKGLRELARYAVFAESLPLAPRVEIYSSEAADVAKAAELAAEEPELLVDEEGNLLFFDALVAAIWESTKLTLATTDEKLIKFGKGRPELKDRVVILRKSAQ